MTQRLLRPFHSLVVAEQYSLLPLLLLPTCKLRMVGNDLPICIEDDCGLVATAERLTGIIDAPIDDDGFCEVVELVCLIHLPFTI